MRRSSRRWRDEEFCLFAGAIPWRERSACFRNSANSKFLGGGTNLVDLMRENIEQPDALIDVTRLSAGRVSANCPTAAFPSARRSGTARWRIIRLMRERYPAVVAGDFVRRVRADSKYGDHRRQPDAAHPVLLLLRRSLALQ